METALPFRSSRAALRRGLSSAFSIMELVIVIALMGLIITVAVNITGDQPTAVKNSKLASDVATLNQMINIYVGDGGDLKNALTPKEVLEKLKSTRPTTEWKTHTGPASGRLIDVRLSARVTNQAERSGQERARWNRQTSRFELITTGGSAVSEFYLDESLTAIEPGAITRTATTVTYNAGKGKDRGWVWGNTRPARGSSNSAARPDGDGNSVPFDPEAPAPMPPEDGGGNGGENGGGGSGGNGGDGGGGTETPTKTQLPKPGITPGGGTYGYTAFPGQIMLTPNGAPAAGSALEYRVNNGPWSTYTGSPLSVGSADVLEARNRATDSALYRDSALTKAEYYRLVPGFTGSNTATWGNAQGGTNLLTNVQNSAESSTFKHGNTKLDLGNGEFLDAGVENVLTFTPKPFEVAAPDTWFDLGNLVMLNGNTFYNSEAEGVTLSIDLKLTEPGQAAVVHVNLGLISTTNVDDDRMASADIVELRNPSSDFKFMVDGVEYQLELSWASLAPGAGVVQGNKFLVYETASASAVLRGRFVPSK